MKTAEPIMKEIGIVLNKAHQLLQEGLIQEGVQFLTQQLHDVTIGLSQECINSEVREVCLQHPVAKIMLQDPITRRSFQKPRGYAGDAVLIDYMYRLKSCTTNDSYLGRELFGQFSRTGASAAVRWRSNHIAERIQELQSKLARKIDVISVASGHLRELAYVDDAASKINRFVCLDQDEQSNDVVRSNYNQYPFMEIIDKSISYILKRQLEGQSFDFIYSAGLFDYLNDKVASKMIEILYSNLKPGGLMIIPNFLKGITEKIYMDTFMKWNLIYRSESDMKALCTNAAIPKSKFRLYRDDVDRVVYVEITK